MVALAHGGYLVAVLAGLYGGTWIVARVVGPVPIQTAMQELVLLALLVWLASQTSRARLASLALVSRITYRLTRRRAA